MKPELLFESKLVQNAPNRAIVPFVDEMLEEEIQAIPNRLAFKIGEVADLLDVKPHVLRYWQSEFKELKPKKASNNQRMYSKKDVETCFVIRKLLYRDRFSIEGAKKALVGVQKSKAQPKDTAMDSTQILDRLDNVTERLADLQRLFS